VLQRRTTKDLLKSLPFSAEDFRASSSPAATVGGSAKRKIKRAGWRLKRQFSTWRGWAMKKALCAFLGLSAAAFVQLGAAAAVWLGMTTSADAAEPMVLSDFELDAITAAGVFVDVSSMATALGDVAAVRTDSDTVARGTEHLTMGIGTTVGEALACCGENADVEVGSAVVGIGDIAHGVTHEIEHDGRPLAYGFSMGFVMALSFENPPAMLKGFAPPVGRFPR
jgi:hypothetical protein